MRWEIQKSPTFPHQAGCFIGSEQAAVSRSGRRQWAGVAGGSGQAAVDTSPNQQGVLEVLLLST
ncbi:MAG: hypothetical protein K6U11_03350 [bacterium]|nr:hypothetical protein [bacterium]